MLELQEEFSEFVFATVDIEKEVELAKEFDVVSIPAVMILKEGVIVYADSGAVSVSVLRDLLVQAIRLE